MPKDNDGDDEDDGVGLWGRQNDLQRLDQFYVDKFLLQGRRRIPVTNNDDGSNSGMFANAAAISLSKNDHDHQQTHCNSNQNK